eukprot:NODE_946_length_2684_cov_13.970669.p10 GENE.NODE_946_length_2684_cov_13.970669~~NODE_946_length_2684_cov_13.970669.p10  ORF type:complete len:52 (-),score=11.93 NODE_946_length_2684_cov_13.970669:2259-2414(-)
MLVHIFVDLKATARLEIRSQAKVTFGSRHIGAVCRVDIQELKAFQKICSLS